MKSLVIVHVVKDLDRVSSGVSNAVIALAQMTASREYHEVHIVTSVNKVLFQRDYGEKVSVHRVSITRLDSQLKELCENRDSIVHVHGIWDLYGVAAAMSAERQGVLYVVSTHGMLDEWCRKQKRVKKFVGWFVYQSRVISRAYALIAASEREAEGLKRLCIARTVETMPIPLTDMPSSDERLEREDVVLAVGRISRVKNLGRLIRAWKRIDKLGWRLWLAGPTKGAYGLYVKILVKWLRLEESVSLLGELDSKRRDECYKRCGLFILPSRSENYGMVVAEAMSHGMPSVVSNQTPWGWIESNGCGWVCECDVESIKETIEKVIRMRRDERAQVGERGKDCLIELNSDVALKARLDGFYETLVGR